jgi:hypothetical protein
VVRDSRHGSRQVENGQAHRSVLPMTMIFWPRSMSRTNTVSHTQHFAHATPDNRPASTALSSYEGIGEPDPGHGCLSQVEQPSTAGSAPRPIPVHQTRSEHREEQEGPGDDSPAPAMSRAGSPASPRYPRSSASQAAHRSLRQFTTRRCLMRRKCLEELHHVQHGERLRVVPRHHLTDRERILRREKHSCPPQSPLDRTASSSFPP